jgi:hypothetical protein
VNTRVPGFLKPGSPGVGCWVFRPSGTRVTAPAAKIFNIFNRGTWVTRGNPGVGCWVFYGFLVHKGEPGLSVCAVEAVVGACDSPQLVCLLVCLSDIQLISPVVLALSLIITNSILCRGVDCTVYIDASYQI